MKKRKQIILGATATLGCLLAFTSVFTDYTKQWESKINDTLNINNIRTEQPKDDTTDTSYYKSEYGDGTFSKANQELLLKDTKAQCYNEVAEGATLMRNKNNALPLKTTERRVSIFGNNATNFVYLPSGGGEGNSVSENNMMTFDNAFKEKGFTINPILWDAYKNSNVTRHYDGVDNTKEDIGEVPLSFYTDEIKNSFKDYNDAAIIVISRESGEGTDMWMKDSKNNSKLALSKNEKDMINMVKSSGKFNKIIVIINTTNQLELDWLEEYNIDACLWTGSVGQWGATAIPDLLTGVVNPSGSLVDTWASNSLSAPACVNSGTNTPKYTNLDEIGQTVKDAEDDYAYMSTQVEGIYVGYRYYETRYEDYILKQGNADSTKGSIAGAWDYAKEMVYPFGYGLSYTSFDQKIESVTAKNDVTFEVKISVTNTGDIAGKKSVLLYAQTPYGTYEKENGIEKSAIQLVQFGKTKLLNKGESETITLDVDKYLLASYDRNEAKTYIISEGDYYFAIGDDVHSALNNILKNKGAKWLFDQDGNDVVGNIEQTYHWSETFDKTTFATSKYTGNDVTNVFDECDLNYFFTKPVVKYLSRSDWDDTYPVTQTTVAATSEMIRLLKGDLYTKPADSKSLKYYQYGINKNIPLIQLKDKDYDDPLWEEYLSQYSIDELALVTAEASGTKAIAKYMVPNLKFIDGPMGLCSKLKFDNEKCTTYPSMPILGATYNKELITRRGELMGEESLFAGVNVVNGPGLNLHRTPFNGRSCIYYSEDANLTYLIAEAENVGMLKKGVTTAVKHFVLNDQEFHRQGVSVFFEEQGMREIGLRAFESSLNATDNTLGCMMSFNRLGCVSDNNASYAKNVTRNEWGFKGFFQTDAAQHYSIYYVTEFASGTDLFSTDVTARGAKAISKYIQDNNDGALYEKLREMVHHFHYVITKNSAMNGISTKTRIYTVIPWWQKAEYALIGVLSALTLAGVALIVLDEFGILDKNKKIFAKRGQNHE